MITPPARAARAPPTRWTATSPTQALTHTPPLLRASVPRRSNSLAYPPTLPPRVPPSSQPRAKRHPLASGSTVRPGRQPPPADWLRKLRQTAPSLSALGHRADGTVGSIRSGGRAGAAAGKPSFVPPSRPPSFPTTRPFPSLSPASSRAPPELLAPPGPPPAREHLRRRSIISTATSPRRLAPRRALRQTAPFLSALGRHAIGTVESIRPGVRAGDCGREKPSSVPPARPPSSPPTHPLPFPPPSGPAPCRGISKLSPALRPGSCPPLAPAGAAQTQAGFR